MSAPINVAIHPSQFPEAVRRDLLESLRSRRVNHKFHYDSLKQTQKWLALHQAYSPSRTDPNCAAVYQQSFAAAADRLVSDRVHVVGLGCGGGQKDSALLGLLCDSGKEVFYTPSDVSVAMVLVAHQTARAVVPEAHCFPGVCDLATAHDLSSFFDLATTRLISATTAAGPHTAPHSCVRLFTFFGMIPNFEPEIILPKLATLLAPEDYLLFSANLAPGGDYEQGVRRVLPLYDNELTRDWLMTFLLDLGIEKSDGDLRFVVEDQPTPVHLKRIATQFRFARNRLVEIDSQRFEFSAGDSIHLFFSYRHTSALVRALLGQYCLEVLDEWITSSQQEGVFLVSGTGSRRLS